MPLELHRSLRARRLSLRIDAARGVVRVIAPGRVGEAELLAFVARHASWVRAHVAELPQVLPFAPGTTLCILGQTVVLSHRREHRGAPRLLGQELCAGGPPEHFSRRIRDYLIQRARTEITVRAHAHALAVGRPIAAITVRDPTSRWGSCTSAGRLSLSWRLVLAPEPVLDYVVAHEVAHLVEMNHAPRFWALLATLTPHAEFARAWLAANRAALLRVG